MSAEIKNLSMCKYSSMYIAMMEGRVAREHYRWFLVTKIKDGGREGMWMNKGEPVCTEEEWHPSRVNSQCFPLLSQFELLTKNRATLERIMRQSQMDLNWIALQSPDDAHAATRIAILEACSQILMADQARAAIMQNDEFVPTIH